MDRIKFWILKGVALEAVTGKPNLRSRMAMVFLRRKVNEVMGDESKVEVKPWWKSRMLGVNALTVIAGGLAFLASPDAKLDAQTVGIVTSALGIVNMILRIFTSKPLGGSQ